MKKAVVIYGLGAPIETGNFLLTLLSRLGYEVKQFDPVKLCLDATDLDNTGQLDLVVGISLGGLWAPRVVAKHPRAKMVLIAPFPGKATETEIIKGMSYWLNKEWVLRILEAGKKLRTEMLVWVYKKINKIPRGSSVEVRKMYEEEMARNVLYFKGLTLGEVKGAAKVIKAANNHKVLRSLKNKTLIFAGEQDDFCPVGVAKMLNREIANSRLVISSGGHFDVFTEKSVPLMEGFLE